MSGRPFTRLTAVALPLVRDNVDTDAIIPSREMKSVSKQGLAEGLFAGWRYTEIGGRTPDPSFVLNQPAFAGAQILLGGANFGCGSSREHAAWALAEYGFRAIVAPGFNPIFRGNCIRNGIVPAEIARAAIEEIATRITDSEGALPVTVDLQAQTVTCGDQALDFLLEHESRDMLLFGLDAIDVTLRRDADILAFRDADRISRCWAYLGTERGGRDHSGGGQG